MSTKASVRTFLSMFHSYLTNLPRNHLLDRAKTIILDGNSAVSQYLSRAAHRTATPDEPAAQELQHVNDLQGMEAVGNPERHQEQDVHDHNHSNEHALEAGDLEEAIQSTADDDHSPEQPPPLRSKYTQIRMALLIIGVLTLIVTPGLVLGIVTGQLPWGIALSGAIATVVSLLAGLYYHLSR